MDDRQRFEDLFRGHAGAVRTYVARRIAVADIDDEEIRQDRLGAPDGELDLPVLRALDRLSEPDRELLLLVAWDGLAREQVGRVLGMGQGLLAVRLHRGSVTRSRSMPATLVALLVSTTAVLIAIGTIIILGHSQTEHRTAVPERPAPAPPHRRYAPPCRPNVVYLGGQGGTGNFFALFEVRNRTRHYCRLSRFPRVQLFRPDGRTLSAPHYDPSGIVGGTPIAGLRAGQTGVFNLVFRPLNGSGARRCSPAAAYAEIRVSSLPPARITLPATSSTHAMLPREPINPCYAYRVSRIWPG